VLTFCADSIKAIKKQSGLFEAIINLAPESKKD